MPRRVALFAVLALTLPGAGVSLLSCGGHVVPPEPVPLTFVVTPPDSIVFADSLGYALPGVFDPTQNEPPSAAMEPGGSQSPPHQPTQPSDVDGSPAPAPGAGPAPGGTPNPTPDVTPSPGPDDSVDALRESLDRRLAGVNHPESVPRNEPFEVRLVINPRAQATAADVRATVTEGLDPAQQDDEVVVDTTRIAPRMSATLSVPQAWGQPRLTSGVDGIRAISETDDTVWEWEVTPVCNQLSCEEEMTVTLLAWLDVEGRSTQFPFETYNRLVTVEVGPMGLVGGFIGKNWQWFAGTLAIPLFAVVRRRLKNQGEAAA